MNYGLYLSASGMMTNLYRQDVTANNLANVSTVGFKRDLAAFRARDAEAVDAMAGGDLSHALLDRLGGGVFVQPMGFDPANGGIEPTGNTLDVAIEGRGFFVVRTVKDGQTSLKLTRDGRLTVDASGRLITSSGGHALLGEGGQPLMVDPAKPLEIDTRGVVRQAGNEIGRLRLADVSHASGLQRDEGGLFDLPAAQINAAPPAAARIHQGHVERSNADPIREMLSMIEATRAITNNATMIRHHDTVLDRAANVLGRVG